MAGRRAPGFVPVLGGLILLGSLGATAYYFRPQSGGEAAPIPAEELDVYCSGRVDAAGQVSALEPSSPGRVTAVLVREGATVSAGQPLVTFDASLAEQRLAAAKAQLDALGVEADQNKQLGLRFPDLVRAREAGVGAAKARVQAARKALQQRRLQAEATPTAPGVGRAELEAAEFEIEALTDLARAEEVQLEDFRKQESELTFRSRGIAIRRATATADLALAQKTVADCTMSAPADGTILRLQATAGQIVSPGSPVPPVVFAPAGPYVVRAEVDQEALGRVKAGMAVEVRDENRPGGPPWRGTVRSLARWVAQRRMMVLEPGEISDLRTVECVVELQPGGEELWIGQRMRVRILRGGAAGEK